MMRGGEDFWGILRGCSHRLEPRSREDTKGEWGMMGGMVRRWVIRVLTILLLALCLGAGVASYWRFITIAYASESISTLGVGWGRLSFIHAASRPAKMGPGWSLDHASVYSGSWARWDERADGKFVGFSYHRFSDGFDGTVPLWFPTLVLALLTWFIWRKTRAKVSGNPVPVKTDQPR
jgi:hypothetical protein